MDHADELRVYPNARMVEGLVHKTYVISWNSKRYFALNILPLTLSVSCVHGDIAHMLLNGSTPP